MAKKGRRVSKPTSNSHNSTLKKTSPRIDEPEKRKSIIANLAQKPAYIITSLIISLLAAIGSVPTWLNYFSKKPNFDFRMAASTIGDNVTNGNTLIIIAGSVTNSGEKPLFVVGFSLKVIIDNQEYTAIPEYVRDLDWKDSTYNVQWDLRHQQDLQLLKEIPADSVITGNLWFEINHKFTDAQKQSTATFIIACHDFKGKSYEKKMVTGVVKRRGDIVYPKNGIKLTPNPNLFSDSSQH
jgi:hypothetical protein